MSAAQTVAVESFRTNYQMRSHMKNHSIPTWSVLLITVGLEIAAALGLMVLMLNTVNPV